MDIQLIADSCCDATPAMRSMLHLRMAPLKITVDGTKEYIDDENINTRKLLADMKASKQPVATAAPSPEDYARLMREAPASVVVTLSQKLSGSYNVAMAARRIVLEEDAHKEILVFDSKSASAGELRIVLCLAQLINKGADMKKIEETLPAFIDGMRTFFVLEDLSNLVKNGRIPKMAGMLGTVLMLRPIMGEDGEGEIIPIEKVRGTQRALARLVEIVAEKTEKNPPKSVYLTLSYCNNAQRAADLKKQLLAACPALADVIMAPTGGISTCYANDGGVVIAFA